MKIAIIDADFIGRKRHRFPNLCCMKISGFYKAHGHDVSFKTNYDNLADFDKVFVAKVFTDTPLPETGLFGNPLDAKNVVKGGTGFFYDKAVSLPPQIEHHMPDYHLYDAYTDDYHYTDYSIGFLTRGCFRHCTFCVNRRSSKVVAHSPLKEFFDATRKKICLLDDNFFGFDGWENLLQQLRDTGKPFVFKQGLDVRLLDDVKAKLLFTSRYDGDYIFAFDDIKDAPLIIEKIKLISHYINLKTKRVKFYVLCAFDRAGRYDNSFWQQDISDTIYRINLLKRYDCLPFVMKFKAYQQSPFKLLYTSLANWCNQHHIFLKLDFVETVRRRHNKAYLELIQKQLEELLWTDNP